MPPLRAHQKCESQGEKIHPAFKNGTLCARPWALEQASLLALFGHSKSASEVGCSTARARRVNDLAIEAGREENLSTAFPPNDVISLVKRYFILYADEIVIFFGLRSQPTDFVKNVSLCRHMMKLLLGKNTSDGQVLTSELYIVLRVKICHIGNLLIR